MGLFSRDEVNPLAKDDQGSGKFSQYKYDLLPANARVTLRLADSNPHQEELMTILKSGETDLETAIARRSVEDERIDAPLSIRLFSGGRVTGVVGTIPRGLESVVDEALSRLDKRGHKARIPAVLVSTRAGLRIDLLMGKTR